MTQLGVRTIILTKIRYAIKVEDRQISLYCTIVKKEFDIRTECLKVDLDERLTELSLLRDMNYNINIIDK